MRERTCITFSIMSTTQDSLATTAAVPLSQPNNFFSLPRELRDEIYDILHRHEEATHSGNLTFRYPAPLSHLHLVSHEFTAEFDKRTPAVSRLIISPTSRNSLWFPATQRLCLPDAATRRVGRSSKWPMFHELEVNFDVCDTYQEPTAQLLWFDKYSGWLLNLFGKDVHLAFPPHLCKLHLRLFFNYVSNMDRIRE